MNIFFGKTNRPDQIKNRIYEADENWEGFGGLKEGDYVFMLCEGVVHLWKAKEYDKEHNARTFECVLEKLGESSFFFSHIKYFKLTMDLVVKSHRQTTQAFFKIEFEPALTEEMLCNRDSYKADSGLFRRVVIRNSLATVESDSYDVQLYFENQTLKLAPIKNSDASYTEGFRDNLSWMGKGRQKKDKTLSIVLNETNREKPFAYNSQMNASKIYDAFMVDYEAKEESSAEEDEADSDEVILVEKNTRFWCFKHKWKEASNDGIKELVDWAFANKSCKMQQEYDIQDPEKVTKNWTIAKKMRVGDYVFLRGNTDVYAFGKICKPRKECTKEGVSVASIISSKSMMGCSSRECNDVIHFVDADAFYEDLTEGAAKWGQRVDVEQWMPSVRGKSQNAQSKENYITKDEYVTIKEMTASAAKKFMKNWGYEMQIVDKDLEEQIKLLNLKKNIILQGAPGTGKTYTTAALALSILGIKDVDFNDHNVVMNRYNSLLVHFDDEGNVVGDGQIAFVTFHQSMDYEDFIEGIKPEVGQDSKTVSYGVHPGVFKSICREASKSMDSSAFDSAYQKLLEKIPDAQDINNKADDESIIGPYELKTPTGKIFGISKNGKGNLVLHTGVSLEPQGVLTKENVRNQCNGEPVYKYWQGYYSGVAKELEKSEFGYIKKTKPLNTNYVLIIDEINRGNVSKIFGELITLLEADKRKLVGADDTEENQKNQHTIELTLPYSKETFSVPSNLYIIGTMNTTDRSVGSIDYAVRRRFAFVTLEADESLVPDGVARNLFNAVKNFLTKNKYDMDIEDLMVGHSYFMDADNLTMKWQYEILPLLMEYHKDGIISKSPLSDFSEDEVKKIKTDYTLFMQKWNPKTSETTKS